MSNVIVRIVVLCASTVIAAQAMDTLTDGLTSDAPTVALGRPSSLLQPRFTVDDQGAPSPFFGIGFSTPKPINEVLSDEAIQRAVQIFGTNEKKRKGDDGIERTAAADISSIARKQDFPPVEDEPVGQSPFDPPVDSFQKKRRGGIFDAMPKAEESEESRMLLPVSVAAPTVSPPPFGSPSHSPEEGRVLKKSHTMILGDFASLLSPSVSTATSKADSVSGDLSESTAAGTEDDDED